MFSLRCNSSQVHNKSELLALFVISKRSEIQRVWNARNAWWHPSSINLSPPTFGQDTIYFANSSICS